MRKPFILLQVALLLGLTVAAAALGMADIYRDEAATLGGALAWTEEEVPPDWAWEQVERYLWLASRLAPFDAQIKSDLGQFHKDRVLAAEAAAELDALAEEQSTEVPTSATDYVAELPDAASPDATGPGDAVNGHGLPNARTDSDIALEFYRQALVLRPAFAQDWANLALLKVVQQNIDAEFAFAARRALTLGPWQSGVQASIASGGLLVWDELPASLQTDIEHAIRRGLSSGSRLMPFVARRFGLFEENNKTNPAEAATGNPPPDR